MSEYPEILKAIKAVRTEARWKPNSLNRHLQKRKQRGHLPQTATTGDYEAIVLTVLKNKSARVYRYWYNHKPYVTVVAKVRKYSWLVMFSYEGVMESAFVVERPARYLNKPGFEYIGLLGELDDE